MKDAEFCPNNSKCESYPRKSLDGTSFGNPNIFITLNDGVVINWINVSNVNCDDIKGTEPSLRSICGEIYVDINGAKLPNVVGKDIFLFYYNKYGNVIPRGTASDTSSTFTDRCNTKNKSMYNGYGCTAWVIYNENMDYLHCGDLSWQGKHKCK